MKELLWIFILPATLLVVVWPVLSYVEHRRLQRDRWGYLPDWLAFFRILITCISGVMLLMFMIVALANRVDFRGTLVRASSLQQDVDHARNAGRDLELAAIQQSIVEFNARLRQQQYWAGEFPITWGGHWSDIPAVD